MTIEAAEVGAQFARIEEAVDPAHEMVLCNMRLEIELVEQPRMSLSSSEHPKPSRSHESRESEASAARIALSTKPGYLPSRSLRSGPDDNTACGVAKSGDGRAHRMSLGTSRISNGTLSCPLTYRRRAASQAPILEVRRIRSHFARRSSGRRDSAIIFTISLQAPPADHCWAYSDIDE